jgi:hypothetical protein
MPHTPYQTPTDAPDALQKPGRRDRAGKRKAGAPRRHEQSIERQLLGDQREIEANAREQRGTRRLLWTLRRQLLADERDRLADRRDQLASSS